jgi:hypothetical protein
VNPPQKAVWNCTPLRLYEDENRFPGFLGAGSSPIRCPQVMNKKRDFTAYIAEWFIIAASSPVNVCSASVILSKLSQLKDLRIP